MPWLQSNVPPYTTCVAIPAYRSFEVERDPLTRAASSPAWVWRLRLILLTVATLLRLPAIASLLPLRVCLILTLVIVRCCSLLWEAIATLLLLVALLSAVPAPVLLSVLLLRRLLVLLSVRSIVRSAVLAVRRLSVVCRLTVSITLLALWIIGAA